MIVINGVGIYLHVRFFENKRVEAIGIGSFGPCRKLNIENINSLSLALNGAGLIFCAQRMAINKVLGKDNK
ncbi:hypothetical protein [Paenibacillus periandrae]|uniref:hypothetical protein n=1 Tax=Paenibacillus periandrae TaxID=1761741 RepID=UPI001F093270|nr:hypothetical protein [Paenibacillus periandrae]